MINFINSCIKIYYGDNMSQILQKVHACEELRRQQETLPHGNYPKDDGRPAYVSKRRPEAAREL